MMRTARFCGSGGVGYIPPDILPPRIHTPRYCTPIPYPTDTLQPYPTTQRTRDQRHPTSQKGHGTRDTLPTNGQNKTRL